MNCRRMEQLLSELFDGSLRQADARAMEAHLDQCPACGRVQDELLTVRSRLRRLAQQLPIREVDIERRAIDLWVTDRETGSSSPSSRSQRGRRAGVAHRVRRGRRMPARVLGLSLGAVMAAVAVAAVAYYGGGDDRVRELDQADIAAGRRARQIGPSVPRGNEIVVLAPTPGGGRMHRPRLPGPAPARGIGDRESGERPPALDPRRRRLADDLDRLNGDPEAAVRQFASLDGHEWERIEARVRHAVRVGDDFVQIPFPRLASTSSRMIAAAVESYKREAAIVDPRLSREVACAYKATALVDLCDRLRVEAGIQLGAGGSVADEKVTLFCKKMPLREVMRQLSRPFGYTWLRSGKAGAWKYELVQDLRAQLLEEELRNRDRNAALLALNQEMERYRQYLHLSPDEALAASRTATEAEKPLLQAMAGHRWGPIQMYFRLSPDDLAALRAGQRLDFAQQPRDRDRQLPMEVARGALQSRRDVRLADDPSDETRARFGNAENLPDGVPPASYPKAWARVRLRLGHTELGKYTMDGEAGVCVGTLITIGGGELASGMSPAVRDPENAGRTARWSRVPELRPRVSLRPAPSRRPVPAEGAAPGQGAEVRVTSADVLEALHRASGLPIVADYYTRLHPVSSVTFENVTIYDALNRLSDAMRLRWSWEKDGGWLRFRSASYYDDRLKEVPNRLLARWSAARQRQNWLTLDDLTEIAQLTDVQLDSDTMAEGTRVLFDLQEWDLARSGNFRSHLRFLATLTPEQRRRTMDAAGLPFTALSRTQQQGLMTHLGERIPSLDVLTQLSIRVVYLQPGEFQWVQPGMSEFLGPHGRWPANFFNLPTVRDRTPQGVLLAARRIDPNADPAQIRPTELWLAVMFRQADPQTGKLKMEWGMAGTHAGGRLNW